MTERQEIQIQTVWDPRSELPIPTAASIHATRKTARRALVRLKALRRAVSGGSYRGLRKSLRELIRISSESRDAEVQRRLVARLSARNPGIGGRDCKELLSNLTLRRRKAVRRLAARLYSAAGTERLRRVNEDLDALRVAESIVNLPRLALPLYRHGLRSIDARLGRKVVPGRRVHTLRIRLRRAHILSSMVGAPGLAGPKALDRNLKGLQAVLGDLHDLMLLKRWIRSRGLSVPQPLTIVMRALAQDQLRECNDLRKPLRRAVRGFLSQEV